MCMFYCLVYILFVFSAFLFVIVPIIVVLVLITIVYNYYHRWPAVMLQSRFAETLTLTLNPNFGESGRHHLWWLLPFWQPATVWICLCNVFIIDMARI